MMDAAELSALFFRYLARFLGLKTEERQYISFWIRFRDPALEQAFRTDEVIMWQRFKRTRRTPAFVFVGWIVFMFSDMRLESAMERKIRLGIRLVVALWLVVIVILSFLVQEHGLIYQDSYKMMSALLISTSFEIFRVVGGTTTTLNLGLMVLIWSNHCINDIHPNTVALLSIFQICTGVVVMNMASGLVFFSSEWFITNTTLMIAYAGTLVAAHISVVNSELDARREYLLRSHHQQSYAANLMSLSEGHNATDNATDVTVEEGAHPVHMGSLKVSVTPALEGSASEGTATNAAFAFDDLDDQNDMEADHVRMARSGSDLGLYDDAERIQHEERGGSKFCRPTFIDRELEAKFWVFYRHRFHHKHLVLAIFFFCAEVLLILQDVLIVPEKLALLATLRLCCISPLLLLFVGARQVGVSEATSHKIFIVVVTLTGIVKLSLNLAIPFSNERAQDVYVALSLRFMMHAYASLHLGWFPSLLVTIPITIAIPVVDLLARGNSAVTVATYARWFVTLWALGGLVSYHAERRSRRLFLLSLKIDKHTHRARRFVEGVSSGRHNSLRRSGDFSRFGSVGSDTLATDLALPLVPLEVTPVPDGGGGGARQKRSSSSLGSSGKAGAPPASSLAPPAAGGTTSGSRQRSTSGPPPSEATEGPGPAFAFE